MTFSETYNIYNLTNYMLYYPLTQSLFIVYLRKSHLAFLLPLCTIYHPHFNIREGWPQIRKSSLGILSTLNLHIKFLFCMTAQFIPSPSSSQFFDLALDHGQFFSLYSLKISKTQRQADLKRQIYVSWMFNAMPYILANVPKTGLFCGYLYE